MLCKPGQNFRAQTSEHLGICKTCLYYLDWHSPEHVYNYVAKLMWYKKSIHFYCIP